MTQKGLITALSQYFSADTPDLRASTLTQLINIYRQAKSASEPESINLSLADVAKFRDLANHTGHTSPSDLLAEIAATPPLLEYINDFLVAPTVKPKPDLPEIIIKPENCVSRSIARIGIGPTWITVLFPEKREDFRELVKFTLGYDWDSEVWRKTVSDWSKAINAAAELGHQLLAAGFWVAPPTPEIKTMIIEESFEAEHRRKVMLRTKGNYEGWFVIWWARSEDYYDAAKRITASRYDKPNVVVPPECYDEVEDFASCHDFYITSTAQQAIERARDILSTALLLKVDENQVSIDSGNHPIELVVPENVEVQNDLADYD